MKKILKVNNDDETKAAVERSIECLNNFGHEDISFILITEPKEDKHVIRTCCNTLLMMNAAASLLRKIAACDPEAVEQVIRAATK